MKTTLTARLSNKVNKDFSERNMLLFIQLTETSFDLQVQLCLHLPTLSWAFCSLCSYYVTLSVLEMRQIYIQRGEKKRKNQEAKKKPAKKRITCTFCTKSNKHMCARKRGSRRGKREERYGTIQSINSVKYFGQFVIRFVRVA